MNAPEQFAKATLDLIRRCGGDGGVLSACLGLAHFADFRTGKGAHPSLPTLSQAIGLSESATRRSIKRAVELNLLRATPRYSKFGTTLTTDYDCLWLEGGVDATLALPLPLQQRQTSVDAGGRVALPLPTSLALPLPNQKNPIPDQVATTPQATSPTTPPQLPLEIPTKRKPRHSPEQWALANQLAKAYEQNMPLQVHGRAEPRNVTVLLAALKAHELPELVALMQWANTSDWHNGSRGSKTVGQFFAKDWLATCFKDRLNKRNGISAPTALTTDDIRAQQQREADEDAAYAAKWRGEG